MKAQLGSYTELRHDMTLVAEQAEVIHVSCSHPEVYVEPNLPFWEEMKNMVQKLQAVTKSLIYVVECKNREKSKKVDEQELEDLKVRKKQQEEKNKKKVTSKSPSKVTKKTVEEEEEEEEIILYEIDPENYKVDIEEVGQQDNTYRFLTEFNVSLEMLIKASQLELSGKNLEEEPAFYEGLKGITYFSYDSYGSLSHNGWYFNMFYDLTHLEKFDFAPEVADIFTDHPDPMIGDNGCILHLGTMLPKVGVLLLNEAKGLNKVMPFVSYNAGEVYLQINERLSDEKWKQRFENLGTIKLENNFIKEYKPDGLEGEDEEEV